MKEPLLKSFVEKHLDPVHVPVIEFAESEDYCGRPLYPNQRVLLKLIFLEEMEGWEEDILTSWIQGGRNGEMSLSPDIRERRDICRERGYDHFGEIDMIGGRRSSKGYVTGIAGALKLFRVWQIPNPGKFFGMDLEKVIDFTCIAASEQQAITRQFADLRSTIIGCKALKPWVSKDLETILTIKTDSDQELINQMKAEGLKVSRDFAKLRVTPIAANADTVRGNANILLVFDEMAFMMPGESRAAAAKCYEAAEPSLAQFGYHSLIFCNSSPATKVGQFYDQYELSMRPKNHPQPWYPMRFAIQFPTWAMYDKWWTDHDKRFIHPVMSSPDWPDQLEPDVPESALDSFALDQREKEQLLELANPDTYKVERRGQWAEVLDAYLDPVRVDIAFNGIKPDGEPCVPNDSGTYLYDFKAHCDPSSTTAGFGFAIGHVEEFPDPTGIFPDGMARHVVFDFVKRWNPQHFPGGTINYIKVREELEHIITVFRPSEITFDQYNSTQMIQELREYTHRGGSWETRVGKVDATSKLNWDRWEAFKTALYLGLIHIPPGCITDLGTAQEFNHSEYAALELKNLQEVTTATTKRVDKQDLGPIQTKDVADCIAEVTFKFLASYIGSFTDRNLKSTAQFGSEGGYQIGGRQPGGPMSSFNPGAQGRSLGSSSFDDFYGQKRGTSSDPRSTRGIRPGRR